MPSARLDSASSWTGFVPIFLVNLVPLLGVVFLNWNPATLIAVYIIELLCSFPLAALKSLFAQQPPRTDPDGVLQPGDSTLLSKRGSASLFSGLPPVYPRNIPFAMTVLGGCLGTIVLIGFGVAVRVPFGSSVAQTGVLLSAGGLVLTQVLDIWRDYFRNDRYEDVSPYSVIEPLGRQAFFLFFLLVAVPIPEEGTGPVLVLGVFVVFKIVVELSVYRVTHTEAGGGRLANWLTGPEPDTETENTVAVPDEEPDECFQTDRTAAMYVSVSETLLRPAFSYAGTLGLGWLMSVLLYFEDPSLPILLLTGCLALIAYVWALAVRAVGFYLQYAPMEYRLYGDQLIAYGTTLEEPQWSTSTEILTDVAVVQDRLADRLTGARTIAMTTGWGEDTTQREAGPLQEPDRFVEALDLPVVTTDLDPVDRRPMIASVCCIMFYCVAVVVGSVSLGTGGALFYGLFLLQVLYVVVYSLWKRSYPDWRNPEGL